MAYPRYENRSRDEGPGCALKGCGCALLAGIGLLACAAIMGAVMGDYIGPPEGAAQDSHNKTVTVFVAFGVIIACALAGVSLLLRRNRRP